jgi:hypothetical protein
LPHLPVISLRAGFLSSLSGTDSETEGSVVSVSSGTVSSGTCSLVSEGTDSEGALSSGVVSSDDSVSFFDSAGSASLEVNTALC